MRSPQGFEKMIRNMECFENKEGVKILQIRNQDTQGNGTMSFYEVMPGITLTYNDFHMAKVKSDFIPSEEIFCVDYCREGRIEQEISKGVFRYVGTNDIRLDNRKNHATDFFFPLSHYHGITIQFELDKADKSIRRMMPEFPVSVDNIRQKYCAEDSCSYLRNETYLEHIFEELYHVPALAPKQYMTLKSLELLICLWNMNESDISEPITYFAKSQTDKVKAICELISKNLKKHYTVEELAEKYQLSATGMKNTFKGIYGKPIYTYLQEKRMERAAILMKEGNMSILDIACEVGYESPSKFSAAFKKIMNLTPTEFRSQGSILVSDRNSDV
ncbi:helix-turn-helix domain-containing protein [Clostridium cadaveris]|uniref:helix-turn-helix domain-containing protein n=1 Tax=Clostridium cadaveris TaxID=1529 RepID=UPI0015B64C19|nr:AraC family transcriptional regulator [Clostridium cadaveris]NWK09932.1 helix-turn-helix transcriptional regulator [Clostridium cadaveris]